MRSYYSRKGTVKVSKPSSHRELFVLILTNGSGFYTINASDTYITDTYPPDEHN